MKLLILTATTLVACVVSVPQGGAPKPPPPPPSWFLNTLDSADKVKAADGTKRNEACETAAKSQPLSKNRIIIPDSEPANICVNFPSRGYYQYDEGIKGACVNGCCQFLPPRSKAANPSFPGWFEARGEADCANAANVNNAPLFFKGQEGDSRTICIEVEKGEYRFAEGRLACSFKGCCQLFFPPPPAE